jgi:hypothetical protein
MAGQFRKTSIPNHGYHTGSGRGVVRLNGHGHYAPFWGTPEAEAGNRRLVAERLANDHFPKPDGPAFQGETSATPTSGSAIGSISASCVDESVERLITDAFPRRVER